VCGVTRSGISSRAFGRTLLVGAFDDALGPRAGSVLQRASWRTAQQPGADVVRTEALAAPAPEQQPADRAVAPRSSLEAAAEHACVYAYALTAHRARGTTVDEAFVLGSDELYRE
jgi:hypothetical protein